MKHIKFGLSSRIGAPRWALKAQLNQYFIGFTNGRVE